MGVFDCSYKVPGRTDCKPKNPNGLQCTVAEKLRKTPQNGNFGLKKKKNLVTFECLLNWKNPCFNEKKLP